MFNCIKYSKFDNSALTHRCVIDCCPISEFFRCEAVISDDFFCSNMDPSVEVRIFEAAVILIIFVYLIFFNKIKFLLLINSVSDLSRKS